MKTTTKDLATKQGWLSTPKIFTDAIYRVVSGAELASKNHAKTGHLWRQSACSILLAMLRMMGARL